MESSRPNLGTLKSGRRRLARALVLVFLLSPAGMAHGAEPALKLGPVPAPPAELPPEWRRGYELAHAYCQACHLFPEPALLDKQHWNGAFRLMAPLLGVGRIDFSKRADGKILQESGRFPSSPLITEEDWRAVIGYYRHFSPAEPLPQKGRGKIEPVLKRFRPRPLNYPGASALTTMVQIDPVARRIFVGNAESRTLDIISSRGELQSRIPVESPPVSLVVRDGGWYLTLIGHLFPSDLRDGKLVFIEKVNGEFKSKTLLENLARPTHASISDLNGDGLDDIAVSCFGNYLGKFSWFENLGQNRFKEHLLIERPGAIRSIIADINRDRSPDLLVLMAQAAEGIHLFESVKGGQFRPSVLAEFHPLFGSTSIEMADFNADGLADLLLTNGDNGEYPSPFKNYHGIRILRNEGNGRFRETFFYPLNGAFKALAADFDHDNDIDIAAISFYPDLEKTPEESFVYLENRGDETFQAFSFPDCTAGRWLAMDAGDVDGDGDIDLVLGSFVQGPPSVPIPERIRALWLTNRMPALILENYLNPGPLRIGP